MIEFHPRAKVRPVSTEAMESEIDLWWRDQDLSTVTRKKFTEELFPGMSVEDIKSILGYKSFNVRKQVEVRRRLKLVVKLHPKRKPEELADMLGIGVSSFYKYYRQAYNIHPKHMVMQQLRWQIEELEAEVKSLRDQLEQAKA